MRISDWSSDVCSSDLVTDIKAPVLGQYGGLDRGIPVADVDAMRTALRGAGKPAELVVYPQADHGFMADYRASYTVDAPEKAFARALAWFRPLLKQQRGEYVKLGRSSDVETVGRYVCMMVVS